MKLVKICVTGLPLTLIVASQKNVQYALYDSTQLVWGLPIFGGVKET